MQKRSYFLSLFSLFILAIVLIFQVNLFSEEKKTEPFKIGGTYRRPLEFNPKTLDPALAIDLYAVTIIQQVFDGLVQFDKDLNVVPAIARSWKVSPDGLTYTFFLREGVNFHNGREVVADDFVYSFTRIIDPQIKSPAAPFLEKVVGFKEFQERRAPNVKGLKAIDQYTFQINLTEPYSPFLSILGMNKFKVLPREEVEKPGTDFGKFPVGTGPFKFISMKEGEEIVLEVNPDYFEGRPFLNKVIFKIYHGAPREKIFTDFKEGRLEESFIPPDEIEEVLKQRQYPFVQKPLLSLRFYGFNLRNKPLDDKKLRKAISLAIDKKFIILELHKNQFNLAKTILPPGMPGYDPKREPYSYNETLARKFLMESGYGKEKPVIEVWSASKIRCRPERTI